MDARNKFNRPHIYYIMIAHTIVLSLFTTLCFSEVKYVGTYSSLEYHEESGDLLGAELRIVWTRDGYQSTFQISEGESGSLILVRPVFKKDKIIFRIDIPKGIFEGKISNKGIIGILKYDSGGELQLNLKRKKSYWD